jgi:hypothetical protein
MKQPERRTAFALIALVVAGCDTSRDLQGGGPQNDAGSVCDCAGSGDDVPQSLVDALDLCDAGAVLDAGVDGESADVALGIAAVGSIDNNDCLAPRDGCRMVALSTGPLDQVNPNDAVPMGEADPNEALDPQPAYQGDEPITEELQAACDRTQLRLALRVPNDKAKFLFDFLFASAEYPEFVDQGYNDTFYAIMESASLNGGATTSIAFNGSGSGIDVTSMWIENEENVCDETGSGWGEDVDGEAGSTGWLRTSWPMSPGEEISLTFSIHDEGDCLYDSIVLIDGFKWLAEAPEPNTVPID